jgi:hypothetical protein
VRSSHAKRARESTRSPDREASRPAAPQLRLRAGAGQGDSGAPLQPRFSHCPILTRQRDSGAPLRPRLSRYHPDKGNMTAARRCGHVCHITQSWQRQRNSGGQLRPRLSHCPILARATRQRRAAAATLVALPDPNGKVAAGSLRHWPRLGVLELKPNAPHVSAAGTGQGCASGAVGRLGISVPKCATFRRSGTPLRRTLNCDFVATQRLSLTTPSWPRPCLKRGHNMAAVASGNSGESATAKMDGRCESSGRSFFLPRFGRDAPPVGLLADGPSCRQPRPVHRPPVARVAAPQFS